MLPRVGALRKAYAEYGGRVVTATLLREPVSQIFSAWHMWPPKDKLGNLTMSFPTWMRRVEGAQAGLIALKQQPISGSNRSLLSVFTGFAPPSVGMHNPFRCAPLAQARAALAAFDVVAVTECIPLLTAAIELRLRMPADTPAQRTIRGGIRCARPPCHEMVNRPITAGPKTPIGRSSHEWSFEALNASSRRTLLELAVCDLVLYRDAVRRAQAIVDELAPLYSVRDRRRALHGRRVPRRAARDPRQLLGGGRGGARVRARVAPQRLGARDVRTEHCAVGARRAAPQRARSPAQAGWEC